MLLAVVMVVLVSGEACFAFLLFSLVSPSPRFWSIFVVWWPLLIFSGFSGLYANASSTVGGTFLGAAFKVFGICGAPLLSKVPLILFFS